MYVLLTQHWQKNVSNPRLVFLTFDFSESESTATGELGHKLKL